MSDSVSFWSEVPVCPLPVFFKGEIFKVMCDRHKLCKNETKANISFSVSKTGSNDCSEVVKS